MRSRAAQALSLDDFESMARRHLPRPIFAYIANGSETNGARDDNRAAFREFRLLPKVLVDVTHRDQSTELFGTRYSSPFGVGPLGLSALAAYRGDIALASAAKDAALPMVLSGASLTPMEEIARLAPKSWFQAYLPGDVERIDPFLDRIAAAGFRTLVVTVDVPVIANRENAARSGFTAPLRPNLRLVLDGVLRPRWTFATFLRTLAFGIPHFENAGHERGAPLLARRAVYQLEGRERLTWDHVRHVRRRWNGRLVLKGILRVEDAARAVGEGIDGIVLSNHGGRQLDGAAPAIHVLPAVRQAVGGSYPLILDGGVRRGTDVLKALALGASFVFVGRPFIFAAAVGGQAGVARALQLLSEEIDRNMALLGIGSLEELDASFVQNGPNSR